MLHTGKGTLMQRHINGWRLLHFHPSSSAPPEKVQCENDGAKDEEDVVGEEDDDEHDAEEDAEEDTEAAGEAAGGQGEEYDLAGTVGTNDEGLSVRPTMRWRWRS